MRNHRPSLLALAALVSSACTHWMPVDTYGERRELARRPVGAAHLVETTDLSISGGFLQTSERDGSFRVNRGIGSASGGSVKQTFCAQTMQIDYSQPVETNYQEFGRAADYGIAAMLGIGGVVAILINKTARDFHEEHFSDPFFDESAPGVGGYVIGTAMLGGGIVWAGYSASTLPKGPRPASSSNLRTWTEERLVEVPGCALPGAAPAPAPGSVSPAAQRLEELKRLHDSGVLTDEEYERKRKAAADAL